MMAYLAPLNYFADREVKNGSLYEPKVIYVITDALFVANRAQSLKSGIKKDQTLEELFSTLDNIF